jgi:hypothetical protein
VTSEFLATTRAWIDERSRHAAELAALEPPGASELRQADHLEQLAATEAGLLRRSLLAATRP